jgi:uncharacterized protein with PIN domain
VSLMFFVRALASVLKVAEIAKAIIRFTGRQARQKCTIVCNDYCADCSHLDRHRHFSATIAYTNRALQLIAGISRNHRNSLNGLNMVTRESGWATSTLDTWRGENRLSVVMITAALRCVIPETRSLFGTQRSHPARYFLSPRMSGSISSPALLRGNLLSIGSAPKTTSKGMPGIAHFARGL